MITELSSYTVVREARIELFEHEVACEAKEEKEIRVFKPRVFCFFLGLCQKEKAPLWDFSSKIDSLNFQINLESYM
jgi:hypothetical protein